MLIANSTAADIDIIFKLYDDAVEHQKKVFNKHWQGFDRSLVETEIREKRQFKIVVDNQVACIFAITFNDELIWKEKDRDPSIYIHRIVTNPTFRGQAFVKHIISWAKEYCRDNHKQFIRMDTWADNQKLLDYYIQCGFDYVGISHLGKEKGLPKHYEGISLSLFEIAV